MDISILFKIAAIGILITVITQILVGLAGMIIVLTLVIGMIADLFETIKNIFYLF